MTSWCRFPVLLFAFISLAVAQQTPAPTSTAQPAQLPTTTLKVSVNLVQLDAVVTDSKGKIVNDLKPEEFEALQDGKPQKITSFEFVAADQTPRTRPSETPLTAGKLPMPVRPSPALKPQDVRRTIALVVDDLGLSFESTVRTRDAVRKFIEEQVQPGDLVAVICTGRGMGIYQQFTTDKRLLLAAADQIRFRLNRVGVNSFAPISATLPTLTLGPHNPVVSVDQGLNDYYSMATIGALDWIVRGMWHLPGRKSVVLFAEQLDMINDKGVPGFVSARLHRLVDLAIRSAVVFYTIDPRGLTILTPTAADQAADPQEALRGRTLSYMRSLDGLEVLANETGGLSLHGSNDIPRMLQHFVDDQSGYYLVGYTPEHATFDQDKAGPKFHRFELRVKRPGMRVRSRHGFIGVSDEQMNQIRLQRPPQQQILEELTSPFAHRDLRLELTALFAHRNSVGPYFNSLLFIDGRDIDFADESDGSHKANLEAVMVTFNEDGYPVDITRRKFDLRASDEELGGIRNNGFVLSVTHKFKRAGAYQLRAVVISSKDGNTKSGSVHQFVYVPNIKNGRLALSGIVLREGGASSEAKSWEGKESDGLSKQLASKGTPALRVFKAGDTVFYGYQVINPKSDQSGKPQLEAQVALLHNGRTAYTGKVLPVETRPDADPKHFVAQGALKLGAAMEPGDYFLQVSVTDRLAGKRNNAVQYMDFQIAAPEKADTAPNGEVGAVAVN